MGGSLLAEGVCSFCSLEENNLMANTAIPGVLSCARDRCRLEFWGKVMVTKLEAGPQDGSVADVAERTGIDPEGLEPAPSAPWEEWWCG